MWSYSYASPIFFTTLIPTIYSIALPNFSDLKNNYPGYIHHGGRYHDFEIYALLGQAPLPQLNKEDTSALRLSIALNHISPEQSLGRESVHYTKHSEDSITGPGGLQYMYRTVAFGPFLAMKYKSPEVYYTNKYDPMNAGKVVADDNNLHILKQIRGRQGIIRIVTFHNGVRHADARILLWDCDRFYQSPNKLHMHHMISVEFWETPDSHCSS